MRGKHVLHIQFSILEFMVTYAFIFGSVNFNERLPLERPSAGLHLETRGYRGFTFFTTVGVFILLKLGIRS